MYECLTCVVVGSHCVWVCVHVCSYLVVFVRVCSSVLVFVIVYYVCDWLLLFVVVV